LKGKLILFNSMPTQKGKIIKKVKEVLENSPQGIRYSDLVNEIHTEYLEIKIKVIQWIIFDLHKKFKEILKPERGIFILAKYMKERAEKGIREADEKIEKVKKIIQKEENFYQPFADYLKNVLEECDNAIPLGGNKFKDKWGTPDVIGTFRFSEADLIRPLPEIITAEIKTDTTNLITAFGQSCTYKLFSNKVYLVIPDDASSLDIGRLESLCLKFGIGLIIFNKNNPEFPDFRILVRAIKDEPDYFYVNKYLKSLGEEIKKLF